VAESGPPELDAHLGLALVGRDEEQTARRAARRAQREIEEADDPRVDRGRVLDLEGGDDMCSGRLEPQHLVQPVALFDLQPMASCRVAGAIDPVCRMSVATATAAACIAFEGHEYPSCSERCASTSRDDPAVYVRHSHSLV
jgi:YHS domain-containing protein